MFGSKFIKFFESILKTASQFLFKFFIILQCHYTQFFCIFLAHAFSTLDKRIPSKFQFSQFQVLWWKFAITFSIFSSVSCKITPLSFFRWNIKYFAQNKPIKEQIFETFMYSGQNSWNSCHFWNKSVFLQILHQSPVQWEITPLYFFSWNFITSFRQKEPIKVQILWNVTWAVKSLKFCTLMGSFCPSSGSL